MTEIERKRKALEEIKRRNNAPGKIPKMDSSESIDKERDIVDLRRALEEGTTSEAELSEGYQDEMDKEEKRKAKLKKIMEQSINE